MVFITDGRETIPDGYLPSGRNETAAARGLLNVLYQTRHLIAFSVWQVRLNEQAIPPNNTND